MRIEAEVAEGRMVHMQIKIVRPVSSFESWSRYYQLHDQTT